MKARVERQLSFAACVAGTLCISIRNAVDGTPAVGFLAISTYEEKSVYF